MDRFAESVTSKGRIVRGEWGIRCFITIGLKQQACSNVQILIFRCRNALLSQGVGSVLSLGSIGVFIVAECSFFRYQRFDKLYGTYMVIVEIVDFVPIYIG